MTAPGSLSETASWQSPDGSYTVTYALPLFHEIDFSVNDGYRRIPHGGIETGGLLFGRIDGRAVRIEAMRPIECEHAFGPSFKLSDRDVTGIRDRIRSASTDAELARLQIVGWYIGHTRSELRSNDAEAALFDELFPRPGQLTLLVKPEKFMPTLFAFLVRNEDGSWPRHGSDQSFILPLPGRASKATEAEPAAPPPQAQPRVAVPERAPEPPPPVPERPVTPPPMPPKVEPPHEEWPSLGFQSEQRPRAAYEEREMFAAFIHRENPRPKFRFGLVLVVAGILGCALGYWAYLQLPPAVITLHVQPQGGKLLVWWSPEQTRNSTDLAIRINDAEPLAVSAADRAAGRVLVPADPNGVKVELIARRSLRDSRGIVRYVAALTQP